MKNTGMIELVLTNGNKVLKAFDIEKSITPMKENDT